MSIAKKNSTQDWQTEKEAGQGSVQNLVKQKIKRRELVNILQCCPVVQAVLTGIYVLATDTFVTFTIHESKQMFENLNWLFVYFSGYAACWCCLSCEFRSNHTTRALYVTVVIGAIFWPIYIVCELARIFWFVFKISTQYFFRTMSGTRT